MIVTTPTRTRPVTWSFGLSGYVASIPKPHPDKKYHTQVLTQAGEEVSAVVIQQGSTILVKSLVLLDNHELIVKE